MSAVHPQRGTKALVRHLHNDHETEGKLVLDACSKSAQAKRQRVEALVEVFILSITAAVVLYHIVVPTFTWYAPNDYFGLGKYRIAAVKTALLPFSVQLIHGAARVSVHGRSRAASWAARASS